MAAVVAGLQRGRFLLARLFQDKGLDATLRPRFVLLGTRFSDDAAALLDMMAGVEVHALEYRVVSGGGGQQVLDLASFHRTPGPSLAQSGWRGSEFASPTAGRSPAPASPSPAPTAHASTAHEEGAQAAAAHLSPGRASPAQAGPSDGAGGRSRRGLDELLLIEDSPDLARSYFLRARDSIRSLSSHVSENSNDGKVRYQVGDALLATLALDSTGFHLQVGEGGKDGKDGKEAAAGTCASRHVTDEATFNERLNAVFTLYFNRLGPDRPTA
jgi:hypothetical protein